MAGEFTFDLLGSRAKDPAAGGGGGGMAGSRLTPPLYEPQGARGPVGGALPELHPPASPSWECKHIPFSLGALQGRYFVSLPGVGSL